MAFFALLGTTTRICNWYDDIECLILRLLRMSLSLTLTHPSLSYCRYHSFSLYLPAVVIISLYCTSTYALKTLDRLVICLTFVVWSP
jgi:hypothetical protein